MRASLVPGLLLLLSVVAACGGEQTREYTLVGQILAVDAVRQEVTIRHEDIENFMPAMTMPFKVEPATLLDGREPGDLVTATLVYGSTTAYLSSLEKTGSAPFVPLTTSEGLRPGALVADAAFVDQSGAPRRLSDWRGHRVALTFIYTRCPVPDFCPLMTRHFTKLQETIATRGDLADVRLISVTLDPAYDTPAVLRAHARLVGAAPAIWSFLTGEAKALADFTSQFGLHSEVDPDEPSQVIHNLRTAVIDAEGRLAHNISGNDWTPDDLLAQITAAAPAD